MQLHSDIEWESDYQRHRFSFKEWGNFLSFFRLDPNLTVSVPSRAVDENGVRLKEQKIRLRDLPKHKSGGSRIKFTVQTVGKLVTFETSGQEFQAK